MPKKKTTVKTSEVRDALYSIRVLSEDRIGEIVAELVNAGRIERNNAEYVSSVISQTVNDSISTIMANKGL